VGKYLGKSHTGEGGFERSRSDDSVSSSCARGWASWNPGDPFESRRTDRSTERGERVRQPQRVDEAVEERRWISASPTLAGVRFDPPLTLLNPESLEKRSHVLHQHQQLERVGGRLLEAVLHVPRLRRVVLRMDEQNTGADRIRGLHAP